MAVLEYINPAAPQWEVLLKDEELDEYYGQLLKLAYTSDCTLPYYPRFKMPSTTARVVNARITELEYLSKKLLQHNHQLELPKRADPLELQVLQPEYMTVEINAAAEEATSATMTLLPAQHTELSISTDTRAVPTPPCPPRYRRNSAAPWNCLHSLRLLRRTHHQQ